MVMFKAASMYITILIWTTNLEAGIPNKIRI
jgi:hypothetical protein